VVFQSNEWRVYIQLKWIASAWDGLVENGLQIVRFSKSWVKLNGTSYCAHLGVLLTVLSHMYRRPSRQKTKN
jgi:hypothetical protein